MELLPAIGSDRLPPSPFELTLRAPDGVERRVTGTAILAHINGPRAPLAMVRLRDIAPEDVPPGTEVWTA